MSDVQDYDDLVRQYEQGEFDLDQVDNPRKLPESFWRRVLSPHSGVWDLDRKLARYVLRWAGDQKQPFRTHVPIRDFFTSFEPRNFISPIKSFLRTLRARHGRGFALYHGLRLSCAANHRRVLRYTMEELTGDGAEGRRELLEALTLERSDGHGLDNVEAHTDAGSVARDFINEQNIDTGPLVSALVSEREYEWVYRRLFLEPDWTDEQRAHLLLHPVQNEDTAYNYDHAEELFRMIGRRHDGQAFAADPDNGQARSMEKTLEALRTLRDTYGEEMYLDSEALDEAIEGLQGKDHDRLIELFEAGDVEALKLWRRTGGSFRAHELKRAAEHAHSDPAVVEFVQKHYQGDVEKLTRALVRSVQGAVRHANWTTDNPLASARWLIEQGADPQAVTPSLFETYINELYDAEAVSDQALKIAEEVASISATPKRPERLRRYYDVDDLPLAFRRQGASVFEPLLQARIYPDEKQLQALSDQYPDKTSDLVECLPRRKRQYARSAIRKSLS